MKDVPSQHGFGCYRLPGMKRDKEGWFVWPSGIDFDHAVQTGAILGPYKTQSRAKVIAVKSGWERPR